MKKFAPCCQKGWMISCAVYGVLYGAFYYTACVRPQFTTIAALCGAAALALLVTAEPTDSKGERRLYGIGWIILMLLALNVRYKVGLVTMAVTLCAIGVRVLLQKKLSWRRALGLILTLGVLYGVSVGTTALYKTEDWQSYQQFNIVRSRFMDYPGAPYQDLEDVYTALGWDEPLYNMVRSWYFLDERVTESAFDTIAQANLDWFGEKEQVSALRLGGTFERTVPASFPRVRIVDGMAAVSHAAAGPLQERHMADDTPGVPAQCLFSAWLCGAAGIFYLAGTCPTAGP